MFHLDDTISAEEKHRYIVNTVRSMIEGETDDIANMANVASVLWHTVPDINWVGFYRFIGNELVLGPFQGRPACIRIAIGNGVCGTAAQNRTTVVVDDVDEFPGHIACDAASRSEVVIPVLRNGSLVGVLDVDSPVLARFTAADVECLETVAALVAEVSGL